MKALARLSMSGSVVALLSSAAYAHPLVTDPAHPKLTISPEAIAKSPAARDLTRPRRFNVILKPGAENSAGAVQSYFKGFGFQVQYHPPTNSIELHGSYAQAEQAGGFTYVNGAVPRTPLRAGSPPHFPAAFADAILATTFDPGPVMDPQFSITLNAPGTLPSHQDPVTGATVEGLGPPDYATIYGYNKVYAAGIDGTGQTVDIAACFGYLHGATAGVNDDITQFQKDFGLSPAPKITAIYPSGVGFYSYSGEPLLDLSRVYGTAPGANIRIWFAPFCTFGEFTNLFLDIANDQAAHPAAAFSISYGLPELYLNHFYGSALFTGMDAALSKITGGAAQKVALFAASGDDGDDSLFTFFYGQFGYEGSPPPPVGTSDVLYPASDPNVLAVGGTTVIPVSATNVTRQAEYAWSGATLSNLGGTGGGVSNIWPIPTWQKCNLSAGTGACGPQASQTFKNVPDISATASLQSATLMVVRSQFVQTGGTSASSPTLAATMALVQQYLKSPLTNLATFLYSPAGYTNWLTPVTQGNNGRYNSVAATASNPMAYSNVTGLGVPCLLHFPQPCTKGQ